MSRRAKTWAVKARQQLLLALGGVCAHCGTTENLTFDCILPQGDEHHRKSTDQRMTFYRRQHAYGNLQILCHRCNSLKGAHDVVVDLSTSNLSPSTDYPY